MACAAVAGILVTVGSLALYSASGGSWSPWAGRHAVRGAVGAGIMLVLAFVDFRLLRIWAIHCIWRRLLFSLYFWVLGLVVVVLPAGSV